MGHSKGTFFRWYETYEEALASGYDHEAANDLAWRAHAAGKELDRLRAELGRLRAEQRKPRPLPLCLHCERQLRRWSDDDHVYRCNPRRCGRTEMTEAEWISRVDE